MTSKLPDLIMWISFHFCLFFQSVKDIKSSSSSTENSNEQDEEEEEEQEMKLTQQKRMNRASINDKTGSFQSTIFDTNTSSQQPTVISKTPRTVSTISNTSSVHQALNRLAAGASTSKLNLTNKSPVIIATAKRKLAGYCECCKLRYDNLKQHLTSLQHENFEKNLTNFKDLDTYINESLNFNKYFNNLRENRKNFQQIQNSSVQIEIDLNEKTLIEEEEEEVEEEVKIIIISDNSDSNQSKQNSKLKTQTDIDRLVFESKSLGEKKSEKRRSNAVTKYTELTNKDFNAILTKTPTKKKQQAEKTATNAKSTKRKRKQTAENSASVSVEDTNKKPKIKIKLERNKSNNSWQISSSSAMIDEEKIEIDRKFDIALLELVKESEEEQHQLKHQDKTPTVDNKSKRPKLVEDNQAENQLPSFQSTFMRSTPSTAAPTKTKALFSAKQLNSLNSQILAAQQLNNFCIYMAPTPPLPPLSSLMYYPTPFYMPQSTTPTFGNPLLKAYTENSESNRVRCEHTQQQQQVTQQATSTNDLFDTLSEAHKLINNL